MSVTQLHAGHRHERDPGAGRGERSTSATRPTAHPSRRQRGSTSSGRTPPSPRTRRPRTSRCARRSWSGSVRPAASKSNQSRRGRTSPTSRREASTPSTSGRARPASRMRSTNESRSPSWSGRSPRCSASSPVASERAALPRSRRPRAVSVRPARRLEGRGFGPGHRADRLRHGRSARAHAGVHPGGHARLGRGGLVVPARDRAPRAPHAIAGWVDRRFDVTVDPDEEIVPTLGSKEAIYSFAQLALGEKRLVAIPEPAYPVYERGTLFAGGSESRAFRCARTTAGCPTSTRSTAWDEIALFWVCYPNNPTGAEAPLSFYEELAARAREHGFLLCSDEAYSELWFDEPPGLGPAGRRPHERRRLQHALEALVDDRLPLRVHLRSGRRSPTRCARFARRSARRPRSSSSAHRSQHGRTMRTSKTSARSTGASARRCCLRSRRPGCASPDRPRRSTSGSMSAARRKPFARRLLEHGVVCAPGSFFGPAGEGYVRFALVPTQEECERAAEIVRTLR